MNTTPLTVALVGYFQPTRWDGSFVHLIFFFLCQLPYSPPFPHLTLTSCELVKANHVANVLKGASMYEEKHNSI